MAQALEMALQEVMVMVRALVTVMALMKAQALARGC